MNKAVKITSDVHFTVKMGFYYSETPPSTLSHQALLIIFTVFRITALNLKTDYYFPQQNKAQCTTVEWAKGTNCACLRSRGQATQLLLHTRGELSGAIATTTILVMQAKPSTPFCLVKKKKHNNRKPDNPSLLPAPLLYMQHKQTAIYSPWLLITDQFRHPQ